MFVLIQLSIVAPKLVQLIHKGQHCNRNARKKTTVQTNVIVIIVQTEITKTLPLNILTQKCQYGRFKSIFERFPTACRKEVQIIS